jgi:large subunit ribosomal protein L15
VLAAHGLVRRGKRVKVLGDGEIGRALTVAAHQFSESARAKIEAAGGTCEELA